MDQRALVERAQAGDHDAFAALVEMLLAKLDTAARLILRDPQLAQDAVQDGLIRAWRDLRSLRDTDRFEAWLYRLTVNACLDQARRRRRRPIEVEITVVEGSTAPDPNTSLADRELVSQVLRRLDDRDRAVIVLHYYVGLPLTDVAVALGAPIGTVKSRLHRALGEMRTGILAEVPLSQTPAARWTAS